MIYNVISVSGGKDSTALLLLALERKAENMLAVFADTGHEHPLTIEYVEMLNRKVFPIRTIRADFIKEIARKREFIATKWPEHGVPQERIDRALEVLHPTGNPFLDLCLWKGRFPSTKARFCSEELKRNPIIEQIHLPLVDAGHQVISWQGVRADESASRSNLPETEDLGGGIATYRPILRWTAQDCFDMHKKYGIDPNPLYTMGMGRVGCMPCIHARKDELMQIGHRFPEEVARVREWERLVAQASKRGSSTFFASSDIGYEFNDERATDVGNITKFIEWSRTSRGGRQTDWLRADADVESCSSIYGLCE